MADEPRKPLLPPQRARMASSDSFRAIAPDERELILRQLQQLEVRLREQFGDLKNTVERHDDEIRDMRVAIIESRAEQIETRALRNKVEQLLGADMAHDTRLALLEAQRAGQRAIASAELGAEEAKHSARVTSRRWSAIGSAIGAILAAAIATAVQQCTAQPAQPRPTYDPKR